MRISDWSSDVCSSDLGGDDIRAHVGWYLADAGVPQLERDLGLRRGPLASIRSGWRHTPLLAYVVPIAAVVALFATGLISDARAILDQRGLLWLVGVRSEEHTSELQSLMRISYAVFCLKKKKTTLDRA